MTLVRAANHAGYEAQIFSLPRGWVACSLIYASRRFAQVVMARIAQHKPGRELRVVEALFTKEEIAMRKNKRNRAGMLARTQHWAEVEAGLAAEKQAAALRHQGVLPVAAHEVVLPPFMADEIRSESKWLALSGEKFSLANEASKVDGSVSNALLQHGLDPLIKARLAKVVKRLRADWILHIADAWGDIHPINIDAVGDFDKRVATALREGFFHFSQFLCAFEVLLLQGHELSLEIEHRLLSLEELVVQLGNDRRDFIKVPQTDSRLA